MCHRREDIRRSWCGRWWYQNYLFQVQSWSPQLQHLDLWLEAPGLLPTYFTYVGLSLCIPGQERVFCFLFYKSRISIWFEYIIWHPHCTLDNAMTAALLMQDRDSESEPWVIPWCQDTTQLSGQTSHNGTWCLVRSAMIHAAPSSPQFIFPAWHFWMTGWHMPWLPPRLQ